MEQFVVLTLLHWAEFSGARNQYRLGFLILCDLRIDGRMDGWMDASKDELMVGGRKEARRYGWMDEWKNGWVDEWKGGGKKKWLRGGQMDGGNGWKNRWVDEKDGWREEEMVARWMEEMDGRMGGWMKGWV